MCPYTPNDFTLTNDLDNFDKLNTIKCRLIALELGSQIIILVMVWNQGFGRSSEFQMATKC